jgi:hypothetical protein
VGAAAGAATLEPPDLDVFTEPARCDDLLATKREMVTDTIVANWAWCPFVDKRPNSFT